MPQAKRMSTRTALLAAGTAGFVALGAGIAGADTVDSAAHEIAPAAEQALAEGVAPTVTSLLPEGVGPTANAALAELQETAHDPDKPAPDLGRALPQGDEELRTPLGNAPNPAPAVTDALAQTQDVTGLDGDTTDTVGHTAGAAVEDSAHEAGDAFEELAHDTGDALEDAGNQLLPHTGEATSGVGDELAPTGATDTTARDGDTEVLPLAQDIELPVEGDQLASVDLQEGPLSSQSTDPVEPQSAPQDSGVAELTDTVVDGTSQPETEQDHGTGGEPLELNETLSGAGLPQVAEGVDTETAEDLVAGLSRGTDLLNDLDTSDLVSIEGGAPEQETPEGMTEQPTYMDLPGSEALPAVS